MGHMYPSNIQKFFQRRLYAKGKLSVADCVQALQKAKETLHCAEDNYEEDYMLSMGVHEILGWLTRNYRENPGVQLVPVDVSAAQTPLLYEWMVEGFRREWEPEDYDVFDTVLWKYGPGVRAKYKEIPILSSVTH